MLAAKNFKRNRKRYRSTVVGLFLSVTLFISASSFCAYLTDAVDQLGGNSTLGVQLYYSEALPEGVTPEQRLRQLAAADGVESASTPPTATPACTLPRRTWIRTTGRTPAGGRPQRRHVLPPG